MATYTNLEKYVKEGENEKALQECVVSEQLFVGLVLSNLWANEEMGKIFLEKTKQKNIEIVRVQLLCNWCSSEQLCRMWDKMSQGNFRWNNIEIVWSEPVDYYVVVNKPPEGVNFDKKRTVVFQMEPQMNLRGDIWKDWADPENKDFLKVCKHREKEYNNNEWHLSSTYTQLSRERIGKNYDKVISVVLSPKYSDPGQVKRIDFVKFLEKKNVCVHVYGDNKWEYKDYKGSLPYHCKDQGIFPYKYVFNAENYELPYYYTEKLIDGILGECLTFYWGCPNIRELIDPRAYIQLELSNFEVDYTIVKKAIDEDWHTQRLPYIREAKRRILNDLQFFPRLQRILSEKKK